MCDLEECILRDNPYKNTVKGQTPIESIPSKNSEKAGSINASGVVIGPSGHAHPPQTPQNDQRHSKADVPSKCVPGASHPSTSSTSLNSSGDLSHYHHHPDVAAIANSGLSSKTNKINEATRPMQSQGQTSDGISKVMSPTASKITGEQDTDAPCESELSTKLVKVVPITKVEVGKAGDAKKQADPFFIKISIPKSDEVKVVSGQVNTLRLMHSYL